MGEGWARGGGGDKIQREVRGIGECLFSKPLVRLWEFPIAERQRMPVSLRINSNIRLRRPVADSDVFQRSLFNETKHSG